MSQFMVLMELTIGPSLPRKSELTTKPGWAISGLTTKKEDLVKEDERTNHPMPDEGLLENIISSISSDLLWLKIITCHPFAMEITT